MGKQLSVLVVALCACSSSSSGEGDGSGSVNGTIGGQTYTVSAVISGASTHFTDTYGTIQLSSSSGACDQYASNSVEADEKILDISLANYDATTNAFTAPTAPGTFSLDVDTTTSGAYAYVTAIALGPDCSITTYDQGSAGTVTLTTEVNSGWVYTGTFDVTLASGDLVTGTFSPVSCSAISDNDIGSAGSGSGSATCLY